MVSRPASRPFIERPFLLVLAGLFLLATYQMDAGAGIRTSSAPAVWHGEAVTASQAEAAYHIDPDRPEPARFDWPVIGPISSYFGPEHPLGLDIGLALFPASPIVAAAAGTVSFAGGVACCGYGLFVVVDHGDGYSSLYSHLSHIEVSEGQSVRQAERLGISGDTGFSTSEHLHFELRHHETFLDPLLHLRRDAPLD